MYEFIATYQDELTLFLLGGTLLMLIFTFLLWREIKDHTFLIYIALNVVLFLFFVRNSDLVLPLCEKFGISLQELWQYTEHSFGMGFSVLYLWFIYAILGYLSHFSKTILWPMKLYFIGLSLFIPIDWYLLFVEDSLQSSYQLQRFSQPITGISQLYIISLGLLIPGYFNRVLSLAYLSVLLLLPIFVLVLSIENPGRIFYPYDEMNFMGYRIFITCQQFCFFLENIIFMYAFVFRSPGFSRRERICPI